MKGSLSALVFLVLFSLPAAASPPAVGGVDHVGLTVTDLEASVGFFTNALEFQVSGRDAEYPAAFLTNGEIVITLWRARVPGEAIPFNRKANVGLHHLAFRVASFEALDALHEKVRLIEGVRVEFAPELFYGGPAKHMMIREPSGNRLEFIHRPAKSVE